MNRSEKGRRNFTVLIEEEVKRFSSDIRWFYRQSVASQIFNKWNHVRSLINDEEIYALNLKDKLKLMIRDNEHDNSVSFSTIVLLPRRRRFLGTHNVSTLAEHYAIIKRLY